MHTRSFSRHLKSPLDIKYPFCIRLTADEKCRAINPTDATLEQAHKHTRECLWAYVLFKVPCFLCISWKHISEWKIRVWDFNAFISLWVMFQFLASCSPSEARILKTFLSYAKVENAQYHILWKKIKIKKTCHYVCVLIWHMDKVKHKEDKNRSASRCKGGWKDCLETPALVLTELITNRWRSLVVTWFFTGKLFCLKCACVWSISASWLCVHRRICLLVSPALFKTPSDGGLRANKSFGLLES